MARFSFVRVCTAFFLYSIFCSSLSVFAGDYCVDRKEMIADLRLAKRAIGMGPFLNGSRELTVREKRMVNKFLDKHDSYQPDDFYRDFDYVMRKLSLRSVREVLDVLRYPHIRGKLLSIEKYVQNILEEFRKVRQEFGQWGWGRRVIRGFAVDRELTFRHEDMIDLIEMERNSRNHEGPLRGQNFYYDQFLRMANSHGAQTMAQLRPVIADLRRGQITMSRLQRLMPQALSLRVDFSDADMGFGNRGDRPASQSLGEVPNYYEAYRLTKLAGDSGKTMDYLFGIAKDLKSESNTIDNWSELIDGISEVVAVESN